MNKFHPAEFCSWQDAFLSIDIRYKGIVKGKNAVHLICLCITDLDVVYVRKIYFWFLYNLKGFA